MDIKKITSNAEVMKVLSDKDIAKCITTSGDISKYTPVFDDENIYIAGYVEGAIIAVMYYHKQYDRAWQCHINVLPKYRREYADEFSKKALKWFDEKHGGETLYAAISSKYINVIRHAIKHGFRSIDNIEDLILLERIA